MTPGPTQIRPNVLKAMAVNGTNPDLDLDFFKRYKKIEEKYNCLINTKEGQSLFLAGEAILGLEAACASLIERGDKVLCIANGYFGAGFKDFIALYGGEVIFLEMPSTEGLDFDKIRCAIESEPNIKVATLVHCETPTGVTNNIEKICRYLKSKGILSIVDSVSAVAGEPIAFDAWGIDVLLGGSQKCLSAPTGLTLITLSKRAKKKIECRKSAIAGYYINLQNWLDWHLKQQFPYTQPLQNLYGLEAALDEVLTIDFELLHQRYGQVVRQVFIQNGFELYAKNSFSNTVTAVMMPEKINFNALFDDLKRDEGVLIGGALDKLKGKLFRIGHMGENNRPDYLRQLFISLDNSFSRLGVNDIHLEATYLNHNLA